MRRLILAGVCAWLMSTLAASAASARIVKVLPHFLDLEGRHALSPSLYDRDAYQARLREHPELRSGLRLDVQWRARTGRPTALKLRVELRGSARGDWPTQTALETTVQVGRSGVGSGWAHLSLTGEEYRKFGELTAWRATLWDGETLLAEQKSFLW
jgi:hypothetical protein